MYAFVVATAISGPASLYRTVSDSFARLEPGTLTMEDVFTPISFAYLSAARVSAVSPDWEMSMSTVFFATAGMRYLNSLAVSTLTGIRASFSMTYFPTIPACMAEPQATM